MASSTLLRPLAQAGHQRAVCCLSQHTAQLLKPQRLWHRQCCRCCSIGAGASPSSEHDASPGLNSSGAGTAAAIASSSSHQSDTANNNWASRRAKQRSKEASTSTPFWEPQADDSAPGPGPGSDSRLKLVLVHPQIPQNAGNVARTCAATGVALHLVGPLGFDLDDKKLKRAGLDYWPHVCAQVHSSWSAFFAMFQQLPQPKRLVAFSVHTKTHYAGPQFEYRTGDCLLFGAETTGLPPEARADIVNSGGHIVTIPIDKTHVRSLNLAVSVGVGVFEALRQLNAQTVLPSSGDVEAAARLQ